MQVRTAVVAMLEAWAGVIPLERVLAPLADAVAAPKSSSEGKLAGLRWLATVLDDGRASKALAPAVKAAAVGVTDKAADVREAGSSVMALLMEVSQCCLPCLTDVPANACYWFAMPVLNYDLGILVKLSCRLTQTQCAMLLTVYCCPGLVTDN